MVGVGLVLGGGLDHSQETKEELQTRKVVMSPKMGLPQKVLGMLLLRKMGLLLVMKLFKLQMVFLNPKQMGVK